jgi:hypothetical protein
LKLVHSVLTPLNICGYVSRFKPVRRSSAQDEVVPDVFPSLPRRQLRLPTSYRCLDLLTALERMAADAASKHSTLFEGHRVARIPRFDSPLEEESIEEHRQIVESAPAEVCSIVQAGVEASAAPRDIALCAGLRRQHRRQLARWLCPAGPGQRLWSRAHPEAQRSRGGLCGAHRCPSGPRRLPRTAAGESVETRLIHRPVEDLRPSIYTFAMQPAFASGGSILQGLVLDMTLSSYYLPSLMAHQAKMVDKLLCLDSQALATAIDVRNEMLHHQYCLHHGDGGIDGLWYPTGQRLIAVLTHRPSCGLDRAQAWKEPGNVAFKAGEMKDALREYACAWLALDRAPEADSTAESGSQSHPGF